MLKNGGLGLNFTRKTLLCLQILLTREAVGWLTGFVASRGGKPNSFQQLRSADKGQEVWWSQVTPVLSLAVTTLVNWAPLKQRWETWE